MLSNEESAYRIVLVAQGSAGLSLYFWHPASLYARSAAPINASLTSPANLGAQASSPAKIIRYIPPPRETLPPMNQETAFSDLSAWHSRGYIPHFDRPNVIQSITFRLADAVPEKVIAQWKLELSWNNKLPANHPRNIALRIRIDKYEDAGHGACWLARETIAAMVQKTILFHDGERYRLIAWCIMPNHVHAVIEVLEGWSLEKILHSWKSYSAHEANRILGRAGRFWFPEYFDRFIRNAEHLERAIDYCEDNPVRAGLVAAKGQWRWSSAYLQARTPALPD